MNKLQEINLRDLRRVWFADRPAERAIAWVQAAERTSELHTMLRHHEEKSVTDRTEIKRRDDVDDMLSCCAMIELASLSGFAPPNPQGDWVETLASQIEKPDVRRYYEVHYPQKLPGLFLLRARGKRNRAESDLEVGGSLFLRFSSLTQTLHANQDVRRFTRLLDDFTLSDGSRAHDLLKALTHLEFFVELVSSQEPSPLGSACRGFTHFGAFAADLADLLRDAQPCPNLQAGMWHFHSYWFREMKERFLRTSRQFREGLETYSKSHSGTQDELAAARHSISRAIEVLTWLGSDRWESALA